MSRCFPCPPSLCTRNASPAGADALIESIKLQREKSKARKRRKERKERKHRKGRNEAEEEKKQRENKKLSSNCHAKESKEGKHRKGRKELEEEMKQRENKKLSSNCHAKKLIDEGSGLTDEHEQPIYSQNALAAPDNTKKRKREASPSDVTKHEHPIYSLNALEALDSTNKRKRESKVTKHEQPIYSQNALEVLDRTNKKKLEASLSEATKHEQPIYSQNALEATYSTNKRKPEAPPEVTKHEQPIYSQNALEARTNKRKQEAPLSEVTNNTLKFRIRVPRHRQNSDNAKLCSTSGRTDPPPRPKEVAGMVQRSDSTCAASGQPKEVAGMVQQSDSTCTTSRQELDMTCQTLMSKTQKAFPCDGVRAAFGSASRKEPSLSSVQLMQNFHPPPLQPDGDFCDLDWLFKTKQVDVRKQQKASNDGGCPESLSSWPRARYLPEVGIYALPYTVPF